MSLLRTGARPIPINKGQVTKIVEEILRNLLSIKQTRALGALTVLGPAWQGVGVEDQRSPIGRLPGIQRFSFDAGVLFVTNVLGKKLAVPVVVALKPGRGGKLTAGATVKWSASTQMKPLEVQVFLNSSASLTDLKKGASQLRKELYSALIHEATHLHDVIRAEDGTSGVSEEAYYNKPTEVRAFMQQIVDEVHEALQSSSEDLSVKDLLNASPIWQRVSPHLNDRNRRLMLSAVGRVIEEYRGSLSVTRVATRWLFMTR